jgi:hypothetical protein
MAALTANRSTNRDASPIFRIFAPIADNVHIYQGALVQINASGYATPAGAATATDTHLYLTWGRAPYEKDNTVNGHSLGALIVEIECGIEYWDIDGGDPMTQANVGGLVYAKDDHTVGPTNGSTHYAVAGRCVGLVTLPGITSQQAKVFTIPGTP